jgi:hypothetical protein
MCVQPLIYLHQLSVQFCPEEKIEAVAEISVADTNRSTYVMQTRDFVLQKFERFFNPVHLQPEPT